ncbi:MAG: DNA double-strand break repair nuclease NurA [Actinomycetota bacterium]
MLQLKADPWRPDHGAGAEIELEDETTRAVVDPNVETDDWTRPLVPAPCAAPSVSFVDGVMRTELRVLARDGDARAWGLLGSCASGAVRCDGAATFVAEGEPIARAFLVGSRIEAPPLDVDVAGSKLRYEPHPLADDSPTGLRRGLQRVMLALEQRLAETLARDGLVFADGPLHLDGGAARPVVGVVKRMVVSYLPAPNEALLGRLEPGQRTPLFALGNGVIDRYAWYLRLIESAPAWHEFAGLVRCEVRTSLGLEEARRIADLVARHLPSFAGRPGFDPRAPQNLTPVGALEERLKHRLGSSMLITRAMQAHLAEGNHG